MNFYNENDPRSYNYKRSHAKPDINILGIIANIFLSILYFIGISFIFRKHIYILLIFILIYFFIEIKYFIVFVIKIYQIFAPIHIRNKCRFEPSCSNYMLLAIKKYGLIKGLFKGINRLKRCNINNGGFDNP